MTDIAKAGAHQLDDRSVKRMGMGPCRAARRRRGRVDHIDIGGFYGLYVADELIAEARTLIPPI